MKYAYNGALHIHTKYSDGSSTIKDIAKAAKKVGLSWIIITDHNSIEGMKNTEEGFYDGVAVIVGQEISPADGDHYLAFGLDEEISPAQEPQGFIDEVKAKRGLGFVAHPDESNERKINQKALRWSDWNIKGFDGLEVWNHLSDWVDNYDPKSPVYHYLFKNHIIKGPTEKTLEWWDNLNNESEAVIPGIGGVDVHALEYKFWGIKLKVFPYKDTFKSVTNNIFLDEKLSKDFETAKQQVFKALKSGNNAIVNRIWNLGKDSPLFYIKNKEIMALPGESIEYTKPLKAVVKLPHNGTIRLIYDGQLIWETESKELDFEHLDRGKYRVEVFYKDKPWMFSNPVVVR